MGLFGSPASFRLTAGRQNRGGAKPGLANSFKLAGSRLTIQRTRTGLGHEIGMRGGRGFGGHKMDEKGGTNWLAGVMQRSQVGKHNDN